MDYNLDAYCYRLWKRRDELSLKIKIIEEKIDELNMKYAISDSDKIQEVSIDNKEFMLKHHRIYIEIEELENEKYEYESEIRKINDLAEELEKSYESGVFKIDNMFKEVIK